MSYVTLGALGAVSKIPPTIKKGSTGSVVKQAQELLAEKTGLRDLLPITGIFDAATVEATKQFQALNKGMDGKKLVVDGIIGPQTWGALLGVKPPVAAPKSPSVPAAPEPPALPGAEDVLLGGLAVSPWLVLGVIGAGGYYLFSKKKQG
jgi:hypothetical protein